MRRGHDNLCTATHNDGHVHRIMGTGNYSATSTNMKLAHWPLMCRLLHLVQRGGDWAGPQRTGHWITV